MHWYTCTFLQYHTIMNILIIGASSGIGRELWSHYAGKGHCVAIMARRSDVINGIQASDPQHTLAVSCDIADITAFNAAFETVCSKIGHLDMAIVCAGTGELNPHLDTATEMSTIATNVSGWTNAVDSLFRLFVRQNYGHLVTITSVGGLQPTPVAPAYSASKAFQINYTKSLQGKSKGTPITVTEIRPGLVDTRMAKGEGLFWVMPLPKVTAQIIKAIDSKKRRCIVTRRWRIINYLLKHFM